MSADADGDVPTNVELAMARAIELAERGLGGTSPNPIVGAVVLDPAGTVVGEGWHARAGGPHAETVALTAAGGRALGGTLVVTLEPCNHHGATPPCVDAVLAAGVARVIYAVADPHAIAAGGARRLRESGVTVTGGVLAAEAARSNEAWLHRIRSGRPFVTWKYAATLDGLVAAADGSSRWITGAAARAQVHAMRSRVDVVVVGTGTALRDDPHLTARLPDGTLAAHQPLRVVVGRRPLPPSANVLDDAAPTLLLTDHDPGAVLAAVAAKGAVSVLLEGGPTLAGAFLAAGLIDRVVGYIAPALLGSGTPALGPAGVGTIADAVRLRIDEIDRVGDDVRIVVRPLPKGA